MRTRYERFVQRLGNAVLDGPAVTDRDLRRAVENRAATLSGRGAPSRDLPSELSEFVDKVARHAHMVTQDDVDALMQAGYSQDAIFELTTSAALGAGLGRLERGLAALEGSV